MYDPRRLEEGFELADMARRLRNVVRAGTVDEVDLDAARMRVCYDRDDDDAPICTAWIPWIAARAGGDRTWWAPDVGEQVVLLSPSGELTQAIALPALYQSAHPAPDDSPDAHVERYDDGALFTYDRSTHRYSVTLPDDGEMLVTIGDSFLRINAQTIVGHANARAGEVRWNA